MEIEARYSKYKRQNILILMAVCLVGAVWLGYDGYINQNFINEHTNEDGSIQSDLQFNRLGSPVCLSLAVLLMVRFFLVKDRKTIAGEKGLILSNNTRIAYDSIESVDKTYFDEKGYFDIKYKSPEGNEKVCRLSERNFDNLSGLLEKVISEIS